MTYTIKIIVARSYENIEWTRQFKNVLIYNKGQNDIDDFNPIILPNVGREGHTYYQYIYDHYDELDDYTVFLQGNPFDHSPNLLNELPSIIHQLETDRVDYIHLSHHIINCSLEGCHYHAGLPLKQVFNILFPTTEETKNIFDFGAGAQFIVHKNQILKRPKEFYLRIINLLNYNNNPIEGNVIERFHKLIFTSSFH